MSHIVYFLIDHTHVHLNEIIEKQNEILDMLNAQQKQKPEKVLCVNKDCKVVEFCCDALESKIEEYEIAWYMHKERGKVFIVRSKGYFSGHEYCPFCHASIALYKAPQWWKVQIALRKKDAEELSAILSECLNDAVSECYDTQYNSQYYKEQYDKTQLIMRGITALNRHKEA